MPVEPPIVTPRSLADAYAVLAEAPHRPIAGGTDVMVQLTGELGPVLRGRRRQLRAAHVAEVAAAALEQRAVVDALREPVALQALAGRARPAVAHERTAVEALHRIDDALLQTQQVVAHRGSGHGAYLRNSAR